MIIQFQTSRRFVSSSSDRPSSVSHRIAASRHGQAGFSAAKSAPQFKFIIGLLQVLEMLGVGGHKTRDTGHPGSGPLQVSHSRSTRIKEQVEIKRLFWSRSNKKRIRVSTKVCQCLQCAALIRDSFLFLGQGVGPCHHQWPLLLAPARPDQGDKSGQTAYFLWLRKSTPLKMSFRPFSKVLTNVTPGCRCGLRYGQICDNISS